MKSYSYLLTAIVLLLTSCFPDPDSRIKTVVKGVVKDYYTGEVIPEAQVYMLHVKSSFFSPSFAFRKYYFLYADEQGEFDETFIASGNKSYSIGVPITETHFAGAYFRDEERVAEEGMANGGELESLSKGAVNEVELKVKPFMDMPLKLENPEGIIGKEVTITITLAGHIRALAENNEVSDTISIPAVKDTLVVFEKMVPEEFYHIGVTYYDENDSLVEKSYHERFHLEPDHLSTVWYR